MPDNDKELDRFLEELSDAATLFEEITAQPERSDLGDVLFMEGIEDDETVIEEDILDESEAVLETPGLAAKTEESIPSEKITVPQTPYRRRTISVGRSPVKTQTAKPVVEGMTIGELFVRLVRHSPASKIRVESNTIGSIFKGYFSRPES